MAALKSFPSLYTVQIQGSVGLNPTASAAKYALQLLSNTIATIGGLPIGAVLLKQSIADIMSVGDHGSTFAGNPLVCHAAEAVVDIITEEGFLDEVARKGNKLRDDLQTVLKGNPHVQQVRGLGLIVGVQLDVVCALAIHDHQLLNAIYHRIANQLVSTCVTGADLSWVIRGEEPASYTSIAYDWLLVHAVGLSAV